MWIFIETIKNGIVQGLIIGALSISFSWVYRTTRVFHVAVAVPMMAGAYAAIYTFRYLSEYQGIAVFIGTIAGIAISYGIATIYRYLQIRDASNSLRLVASLGIYFASAGCIALILGPDIKFSGLSSHGSWRLGSMVLTEPDIRYVTTSILILLGLVGLTLWTDIGREIAGAASNRLLFLALGKNEVYTLSIVFGISGGIAGLLGAYEGLRNGADPYGFLPVAITAAVAALLGQRGLVLGPMIMGLLLGILRALTTQLLSDRWTDSVIFGLLFILLCLAPSQFLGSASEEERP